MALRALLLLAASLLVHTLQAQSRPDLYQCEGCEAIYEHDFAGLPWRATIPPPGEGGERHEYDVRYVGSAQG
jgi:hypothetical protein